MHLLRKINLKMRLPLHNCPLRIQKILSFTGSFAKNKIKWFGKLCKTNTSLTHQNFSMEYKIQSHMEKNMVFRTLRADYYRI